MNYSDSIRTRSGLRLAELIEARQIRRLGRRLPSRLLVNREWIGLSDRSTSERAATSHDQLHRHLFAVLHNANLAVRRNADDVEDHSGFDVCWAFGHSEPIALWIAYLFTDHFRHTRVHWCGLELFL